MKFTSALLALGELVSLAYAQGATRVAAGPNTIGFFNYQQRTASQNGTWMIVPLSRSVVQAAVNYPLNACGNDRSIFPQGLPNGTHPVLFNTGLQFDIRMAQLEIDDLWGGMIYVPCVDRLRDGRTNFQAPISSYIGGANGQPLQAYVPALVGSLTNTPLSTGKFYPDYEAYHQIGPNEFSSQVKLMVAANSLSGPGVVPPAFELDFFGTNSNQYNSRTFHNLINQPGISPNGQCFRNNIYFNDTFAQPAFRTGTVTVYNVTGVQPDSFAGKYTNVGGYSANGQVLGHPAEDCAAAAANNDQSSFN